MRTKSEDQVLGIRTGEDRVYEWLLNAFMYGAGLSLAGVFYYAMVINPLDVVEIHPLVESEVVNTDQPTRPPDALIQYGESHQIRQMSVRQP